jgi:hypothetical protein
MRNFLLNGLLQILKLFCAEKFPKRDAEAIAHHFDGFDFRVPAFAIQNIFYRGRRQGRQVRQSVNADLAFFA